jgi:hypothetical protein
MDAQGLLSSILAGRPAVQDALQAFGAEDWTAVLTLAGRLGVLPLLHRNLIQGGFAKIVPAATAAELRAAYYRCHAVNAHLFHELGALLRGFEQAGIAVIPLKGAYLAESIYRDAGLRPMGDLDLLVPRGDVLRGMEALRAAGFAPYQDFSAEVELPLAKHLPPFQKNGTVIELHWDVTAPESPVRVDLDGLWRRAVPLEDGNSRVLALCPEDLLLHLCIHAAHHYFYDQLRSLCDVREVLAVHGNGLDWAAVAERAQAWHAGRGVYLALRLAADLLDARVPAVAMERLCPPDFTAEVYADAQERVFQTEPVLSDNFIALMQGDAGKGRLRALTDAMLPPPALLSRLYGLPQGSWRVFFKYPAHWWDRIRRYRGSAARMLQGEGRISQTAATQQRLTEWLDQ